MGVKPTPPLPECEAIRARPWRGSVPPSRILAIRLQAMGDTVLTLPYLSALQRRLPDARLDLLTRQEVADGPRSVVLFDRVFVLGGARDPRRQVLSLLRLVPSLWRRRYQVVIDLQRNRISRFARLLLSPSAWSEFDRFSPVLAGERTRLTIEAAGIGPLDVRADIRLREPELGLNKLVAAGWEPGAELVALNPAGAVPTRAWPIEAYAAFAHEFSARRAVPTQFVILGIPTVAEKAQRLRAALGRGLIDLVGQTTLPEAFAIIRTCSLMVSEDGGLMHAAWVLGVPTIGLFGASRSSWSRPHGSYTEVVQTCRRPDGTCLDGVCRESSPHCLAHLEPGAVVEVAVRLMNRVRAQAKILQAS